MNCGSCEACSALAVQCLVHEGSIIYRGPCSCVVLVSRGLWDTAGSTVNSRCWEACSAERCSARSTIYRGRAVGRRFFLLVKSDLLFFGSSRATSKLLLPNESGCHNDLLLLRLLAAGLVCHWLAHPVDGRRLLSESCLPGPRPRAPRAK